jgi:hypothetical protein
VIAETFLICALALPPESKVDRVKELEKYQPYVGLMIQPHSDKAKGALKEFFNFLIGRSA